MKNRRGQMIKEVKDKIDELLEHNKYALTEVDYGRIKAYVDLLYHFALPYSEWRREIKDFDSFINNDN